MTRYALYGFCGLICIAFGCDEDDSAAPADENSGGLATTLAPPIAPMGNTDTEPMMMGPATMNPTGDMTPTAPGTGTDMGTGNSMAAGSSGFVPDITIPTMDGAGGTGDQGGAHGDDVAMGGSSGSSTGGTMSASTMNVSSPVRPTPAAVIAASAVTPTMIVDPGSPVPMAYAPSIPPHPPMAPPSVAMHPAMTRRPAVAVMASISMSA